MRSRLVSPFGISGWSASVRTSTNAGSRCDMPPPWQEGGDPVTMRKTVRPRAGLWHPAAMTGHWGTADRGTGTAGLPPGRGPEHRVAALTLAALLFVGGLMGTLNLFVDGVLREGALRWIYGTAMLLCMAAAVPMAVRRRAGRWQTFGLVLLGDLIYLVI